MSCACNMDLQADVLSRTLREGALQHATKMLWADTGPSRETANEFADWYVNNATHWTFCVAWNYWWSEVAT